ncbi:hypothetical protein NPIL_306701, partial [Nephila pilipes]
EEKKDDQKLPSPKSESVTKVSDEEEAHVTEEVDETDGESTITRTITTVTRKIVVPLKDAEETTQEIIEDQKVSSSKSASPAVTPHVDDAQVTEEIDESDGTSTITKTVTTITRKIIIPSEETEEITDDQKLPSPKSESVTKVSDDEKAHVTEEVDETDGESTITRTITTVTRKIVVPSEDAEEKTQEIKDDQKVSSPQSASPAVTPHVDDAQVTEEIDESDDDQKVSSPKSASPAVTPHVDDAHVTEEIDESDGTSTITRTITTVTRKIVVPSEDTEETTEEIKDDQKVSIPQSASPTVTPHVDDAQVTEEIDESDGTSAITRTITTVTRKIVVPSEDAEGTTQEIKDDQKVSSLQSASPAMTHVDDAQITEEIDESDETSTITKTVTTITRKIIAPSEETEEKKDDQKLPSPKS